MPTGKREHVASTPLEFSYRFNLRIVLNRFGALTPATRLIRTLPLRKKKTIIDSISEPEFGVEMFAFELHRPLPMLPVDESYDLRC